MELTESQIKEIGHILLNHGLNCWMEGKDCARKNSEICMKSLANNLGNILVILGAERSAADKYLKNPDIFFDLAVEKYTGDESYKLKVFRREFD